MCIEKISDYLYVSKQLDERFARRVAQYEIKTVICNRPDGEEPNQPSFERVKAALQKNGVENIVYLPVLPVCDEHPLDDDVLTQFKEIVAKSPAPILAYCRTGTRSAMMWAMNQVKRGVEVNSVIKAAELVDINLEKYRPQLECQYARLG